MKKIFFIIAFLLTATAPTAQAALTRAPNNLGLVGYWSFNEGTGLKAGDYSGQGNTGTLTNGPSWSAGKFGGGLDFDGTDDYVDAGDSASGVLDFGTGDFAAGFWVKTTSVARRTVIDKFDNSNVGYYVDILADGTIRGGYQSDSSNYRIRDSSSAVNNGQWHYVLLTKTGATGTPDIYVDGVLNNGTAFTIGAPGSSSNARSLGIGHFKKDGVEATYFLGSLDDVRIYNRAIGANEVARLYNSGGVAKVQSAASEAGTGLVGHWKLDDRAGTRAIDSSQYANHGTLTNFALAGATSNWVGGRWGGGVHFDATNDYIALPSTSGFSSAQDHAYAVWVYPTSLAGTYIWLLDYGNAAAGTYGSSLIIYTATDVPGFFYNGGNSFVVGTQVIPVNQWTHIIASYSSATNKVTFYVNGVLDTVTAALGAWSSTPSAHYIGRWFNGSYSFLGSMDDVRVYNRTLTTEQAKALYTSGTSRPATANTTSSTLTAGTNLANGLVGHWSFDGKYLSTTTARDTSGQGNHGTLAGGPIPGRGKLGQGLVFDGTGDSVNIGGTIPSATTAYTVSLWAKRDTVLSSYLILFSLTADYKDAAVVKEDGHVLFGDINGIWVDTDVGWTDKTAFHHLVIVANVTGQTARVYFDGVDKGAINGASSGVFASSRIGSFSLANPNHFNGTLDDVRVYNRALSAQEVKQLYYLGK